MQDQFPAAGRRVNALLKTTEPDAPLVEVSDGSDTMLEGTAEAGAFLVAMRKATDLDILFAGEQQTTDLEALITVFAALLTEQNPF